MIRTALALSLAASALGTAAYAEGREAGRKIVLHRGVRAGNTARTPLLLPAGGR